MQQGDSGGSSERKRMIGLRCGKSSGTSLECSLCVGRDRSTAFALQG